MHALPTEFNLPGSSLDELQKILKGYSSAPDNTNLDSLSKLIGINPTTISRNNKFLADVGLITGANTKTATELGRKLGRALDHNQKDDARQYWKAAVQTNEKVSGLVTTVRIKGGMSEKELTEHILYVSGQSNTSNNKTGARCVVDVLLTAELLTERDGRLSVAAEPSILSGEVGATREPQEDVQRIQTPAVLPAAIPIAVNAPPVQLAINIQLHLPETENAEVYEKLFKALREQLIDYQPKA